MEKMTLGQVFRRLLRFSPVTTIPQLFQTHFHLRYMLFLQDGKMGEAWNPSKNQCSLRSLGALDRKSFSHFLLQKTIFSFTAFQFPEFLHTIFASPLLPDAVVVQLGQEKLQTEWLVWLVKLSSLGVVVML
jgi:hypothetical protein